MRAVLREAWTLYRRHWLDVVRLTAAFYAGLALITTLGVFALGPVGIVTALYL